MLAIITSILTQEVREALHPAQLAAPPACDVRVRVAPKADGGSGWQWHVHLGQHPDRGSFLRVFHRTVGLPTGRCGSPVGPSQGAS